MKFNVKDMTKKQKLTVLAILGVLGIGGASTVVLNQPKVNTVATETSTSLTSSQLAESQEKAEQEQVLKTAQDIVSDLENNPTDDNVTNAKLAIEAISDEAVKKELATRIGVVETQLQQIAQAKEAETTSTTSAQTQATASEKPVQQPAQKQEQAKAQATQKQQTQSQSKTQTQQKAVTQQNNSTTTQNNTNATSKTEKLDPRKPGDAQKIVERLDKGAIEDSKQGLSDEAKRKLGIPVTPKK